MGGGRNALKLIRQNTKTVLRGRQEKQGGPCGEEEEEEEEEERMTSGYRENGRVGVRRCFNKRSHVEKHSSPSCSPFPSYYSSTGQGGVVGG